MIKVSCLHISYPHNFPYIPSELYISNCRFFHHPSPLKTQLLRSRSAVSRESWAMICPTTDSGNISMSLLKSTWWFIPRIVSGLVHPSYFSGHCPHKNPIFLTRVKKKTLPIRGMNHQVDSDQVYGLLRKSKPETHYISKKKLGFPVNVPIIQFDDKAGLITPNSLGFMAIKN